MQSKGHPYPVIKANDWNRDSATGKVIVDPVTGRPSCKPYGYGFWKYQSN